MEKSVKDNYIEVVVTNEDYAVDRLLPDTEYNAGMHIKEEEPLIIQEETILLDQPQGEVTKEQDDIIVLGSDNFMMVDNNDMNSDTLDDLIVYELENDEPQEQAPLNKPQVEAQASNLAKNKIFLNKNITITRTSVAPAATSIAKPMSGIITIEHTRPPVPTTLSIPNITTKTPLTPIVKRKHHTPCISSRPFRVAKRTNVDTNSDIKVKCMCRLTQETPSMESRKQLKEFFEQMFNETSRLNPHQQRLVKSGLLKSICKAEDAVEQGKCCEKCFSA